MKSNNHGNTQTNAETGPYRSGPRQADDFLDEQIVFEEEIDAPPSEAPDENRRRRRRRQTIFGAMLVLLLASVGLGAWLKFGGRTKIDHPVKDRQMRTAGATHGDEPDQMTAQAIRQAQEGLGDARPATPAASPQAINLAPPAAPPAPVSPLVIPGDLAGTVQPREAGRMTGEATDTNAPADGDASRATGAGQGGKSRPPSGVRSQRNPASSLYMTGPEESSTATQPARTASVRRADETRSARHGRTGVVLPGFGSMLPVRTLGALFTFRTGSLVRFELTRDIEGQGWSMKKGTVLVGTNRGGDYDRAYVAVVGFIDPESGRFARLTGDVLGGDGGTGLRGKRRQVSGGWKRALGRVGSSAVNVAGSLASGFGRRGVVVADAYGYRVMNPVTDELSGLVSDAARRDGQAGFVEVPAGAPGYVMITDLPEEVKGVDALGGLSGDDLMARADTEAARASTGLSERELAGLLAAGSPEQIRAALPRMTPEMRRVALAVLGEE